MKIAIEIDESRFKDIQRIAEVQIESSHFRTAEQIIAKGVPIEQEPILDKIRAEIDSAEMPKNRMSFFRDGINTALDIIDKHRAESEVEG